MQESMTGEGVRVAVIDSGVNPRHPHIQEIRGGNSWRDGRVEEGKYLDTLGHGTAVMASIQQHAPKAAFFAVKVFHDALRTSASTLARALEWAIDAEMDVINLSLGTRNSAHRDLLEKTVQHAVERGGVIVAARESEDETCYPGCLPGVIGVRIDWGLPRLRYRREGNTYCASGYPRPVPGVPPERNLRGISFAVANMTGFVARARQACGQRGIEAVRKVLNGENPYRLAPATDSSAAGDRRQA